VQPIFPALPIIADCALPGRTSIILGSSIPPLSMSRRSGIRVADKDMRQLWNLRRFPLIWDHRVIPYQRKTL
jgi:hypothetical protein